MYHLSGIPIGILALAVVVIAVGAAIQASVSLGLALFSAPLLALLDTSLVPGPMMVATLVLSGAMAYRERAEIVPRALGVSVFGLVGGTFLGAIALKFATGEHLPQVLGTMILLAVGISLSGVTVRMTAPALLIGGTASGIMGTITGMHGPAISLVFQNAEPAHARAMLGGFFAVGNGISLAALAAVGLFGPQELALGAALLPGVAAGYLAAPALAKRVSRRWLKAAILTISGASAVLLLLR